MIGIEMPKDKNTAWGIVVPAFDKVNLGCFSASDEEKDIFVNAEEAILMMAEEHLNDGVLVILMHLESMLILNNGWLLILQLIKFQLKPSELMFLSLKIL